MANYLIREKKYSVSDENKKKLDILFSSTEISSYQHEMDNSFICLDYGEMCEKLQQLGGEIKGFCLDAPWHKSLNRTAAILVAFGEYEEPFWVHITPNEYSDWRNQVE